MTDPLLHFYNSILLYWKESIIFISGSMFSVGLIYELLRFAFLILRFELNLLENWWKTFRLKK